MLAAWKKMRAAEWAFAARAWLVAPSVELALRTAGIKPTLDWLDRLPRRAEHEAAPAGHEVTPAGHEAAPAERGRAVSVEDGTRLVRWACKLQPLARNACLTRSLVQYALHRRDGMPARFVMGVRNAAEQGQPLELDAHAWVQELTEHSAEPSFRELLRREQAA